jgi:hypothetical protein
VILCSISNANKLAVLKYKNSKEKGIKNYNGRNYGFLFKTNFTVLDRERENFNEVLTEICIFIDHKAFRK